MLTITDKAKQLILEFEGKDQPGRWPGGGSGITIGIGYDLGYVTVDQFESDWEPFLSADVLARLKTAIGKTGISAKNRAPQFSDIKIKPQDAESVFFNRTLPLHAMRTEQALPGVTELPGNAQGALLSLVFNRSTSMVGDASGDAGHSGCRAAEGLTGNHRTVAEHEAIVGGEGAGWFA